MRLTGPVLPGERAWASGDQTICEMPCRAQNGINSASGARQIILYCGCDDTHFLAPGTFERRPRICSTVGSLKPVARLPRLAGPREALHRLLDRRLGADGGTGRDPRSRFANARAKRRAACGSARATVPGRARSSGRRASSPGRRSPARSPERISPHDLLGRAAPRRIRVSNSVILNAARHASLIALHPSERSATTRARSPRPRCPSRRASGSARAGF